MKNKTIEIHFTEVDSLSELDPRDANLVLKAREASNHAWAPYSGFRVGAAVLLDNGKVIIGNNQENAAYPSGLCAERVALFAANANYPDAVVEVIAVTAQNKNGLVDDAVKPCGSCRQAILETEIRFSHPIRLILDGGKTMNLVDGIRNLLPLSFGKNDLL
ncbi:MAG: cytidine deaminase [Prolixibacteraceae bacterium]